MNRHLAAILAFLALLLLPGLAYAFPPDGTYKVSSNAAAIYCGNHGGMQTGGGHSGCATVCGPNNSKICDVDCVNGACTVTIWLTRQGVAALPSAGALSSSAPSQSNGTGTASTGTNGATGGGSGGVHSYSGVSISRSAGFSQGTKGGGPVIQ